MMVLNVALHSPLPSRATAPHFTAASTTTRAPFHPVEDHFLIPHGLWLKEATSVAVDSTDHVYVFSRGNMPVLVFDPDGNLVGRWGNPTPSLGTYVSKNTHTETMGPGLAEMVRFRGTEYVRPHSVRVDPSDNVWLVDHLANTVTKCDRRGKRLMVLAPHGQVLTEAEEIGAVVGQIVCPPPRYSGEMLCARRRGSRPDFFLSAV